MARPKPNCSELAMVMYKIAMSHAAKPGIDNIDKVTELMKQSIPEIERQQVVDSIVEVSSAYAQLISDTDKQLGRVRREGRTDKNLNAAITAYEKALADGIVPAKPGKAPVAPRPEAIQKLMDRRTELLVAIKNSPAGIRQKYEGQIAALTQRILDDKFVAPAKREEAPNTKEVNRLLMEKRRLEVQINRRIKNLRPKSWAQRYVQDNLSVLRNVMTGYDASAPGRQGNFVLTSNPLLAGGNLKPMIDSMAQPQVAFEVNQKIMGDERTPLLVRAGLFLSDPDGDVSAQEEGFMGNLQEVVQRIPGVAASQRGYTTFLNKTRFDYANFLMDALPINGEPTLEEAAEVANFVNNATGRGGLMGMEKAAESLNNFFFSPRYVTSRFNLALGPLTGFRNFSSSPAVRKVIAKEYLKYAAGSMAIQALFGIGLAGLGFKMVYDPRSSDFGRARRGNTTVDPTGGMSQALVFAARMASGQSVTREGKVVQLRSPDSEFGKEDAADYVMRFGRGKLAPGPATALDLVAGKNVVGEPVGLTDVPMQLTFPLSMRETHELVKEQGLPVGLAFSLLSAGGFATSTHAPDEKRKKR